MCVRTSTTYGDWRLWLQDNPLVWQLAQGAEERYELPGEWCFSGADPQLWKMQEVRRKTGIAQMIALMGQGMDKCMLGG